MIDSILITGGAGFIGSHAAAYYADANASVRVLDNRSRTELTGCDNYAYLTNAYPEITWINGDIRDPSTVRHAIQDVDAVIHTAGQVAVTRSLTEPIHDLTTNTLGTLTILEAARNATANPVVIVASTNKVYGTNINTLTTCRDQTRYDYTEQDGIDETISVDGGVHTPYGVSKLAADLYVQDYATRGVVDGAAFRMSCIYGPRQYGTMHQGWIAHFIQSIIHDDPITIYGDGRQVRDALYVTDLIRAYDAFLTNPDGNPSVFNIGGGPSHSISLLELIKIIESMTGRDATIRFADWRDGDQRVYITDNSRVTRELDWEPRVSVCEGVRRYLDWLDLEQEL